MKTKRVGLFPGSFLSTRKTFISYRQAVRKAQNHGLNSLGITGQKSAVAKKLLRLNHAAQVLAEDTHISAATKESAKLFSKYLAQIFLHSNILTEKEFFERFGLKKQDLEYFAASWGKLATVASNNARVIDKRFIGDAKRKHAAIKEQILDAEIILRGKKSSKSIIIPMNTLLLHLIMRATHNELKWLLGRDFNKFSRVSEEKFLENQRKN